MAKTRLNTLVKRTNAAIQDTRALWSRDAGHAVTHSQDHLIKHTVHAPQPGEDSQNISEKNKANVKSGQSIEEAIGTGGIKAGEKSEDSFEDASMKEYWEENAGNAVDQAMSSSPPVKIGPPKGIKKTEHSKPPINKADPLPERDPMSGRLVQPAAPARASSAGTAPVIKNAKLKVEEDTGTEEEKAGKHEKSGVKGGQGDRPLDVYLESWEDRVDHLPASGKTKRTSDPDAITRALNAKIICFFGNKPLGCDTKLWWCHVPSAAGAWLAAIYAKCDVTGLAGPRHIKDKLADGIQHKPGYMSCGCEEQLALLEYILWKEGQVQSTLCFELPSGPKIVLVETAI
ncbi:hypothetical protein C8J56DRAFT_900443 [Mycena floridula]|nr:hypothetical protein C8J56DRAFT_900443 [Mycena floridula]